MSEARYRNKSNNFGWLEAQDKSTPAEALEMLAGDDDYFVRKAVAQNASAPPEALEKLAGDDAQWIRRAVAHHPSAPEELIYLLRKS